MIDWILSLFGTVLKFFNSITGNYLLAILLFALFAKILLFPLSIKQQKNMIKQANLRPKEMAIRKKYKGRTDQVTQKKVNEEIMELYREENYSPFGGCLPLLIQFPLIIALYSVIREPLRYIMGLGKDMTKAVTDKLIEIGTGGLNLTEELTAKFAGNKFTGSGLDVVSILRRGDNLKLLQDSVEGLADKIPQVENLPNFTVFGLDFGITPSLTHITWAIVIPVITFVALFFSMKLTKKLSYQPPVAEGSADAMKSMKIMDLILPVMSVWMTFLFPALLGVYWIFQNVLGVLQQLVMNKLFPIPKFTEEDYRRAEKEMKGKMPASSSVNYDPNKKYRSLHHIDDDDYEPTVEKKKATSEKKPPAGIEIPKLKEDDPPRKKDKEGEGKEEEQ